MFLICYVIKVHFFFSLSDGFTEVLFPVVYISISKIVYIQVYSRKQVSIQKWVQKTSTHMQIRCAVG